MLLSVLFYSSIQPLFLHKADLLNNSEMEKHCCYEIKKNEWEASPALFS